MRRHITIALLSVALAVSALAATLPPPYTGSPSAKEYPGADVLVLEERTTYEVAADGRVTQTFFRAEKILTYQGMDSVGDPKLPFRKGDQTLADLSLKAYTPEGEVKEAKPNSFTEITPFELAKAPDYTTWREMVMTKVGLDVGAVAESRWTLADAVAWRGYFEMDRTLTDGHPCLLRTVVVTVPAQTPLRHAVSGPATEPEVRSAGGRTTYTWTFRNLPGLGLSQVGHDERALLPRLTVTTCPDWAAANTRYAGLAQEAQAAGSPELEKKADALVKAAATPYQRAKALSTWVAQGVRTVEWPLPLTALQPRPAARVFETGYGHALDKAVLLCALLKRAGIDAAIAVCTLAPAGYPDPAQVPCAAQFDRVIVHSQVDGKTLWLDPTAPLSERSHRDFLGYKGLPLAPGFPELHTMSAVADSDLLLVDLSARLGEDKAFSGEGTLWFAGAYSPYYGVEGDPDALKGWVSGALSATLPGAELDTHAVAALGPDQVKVTVTFHGKLSVPERGPTALTLGTPADSALSLLHGLHRSAREVPLLLPRSGKERVRLRLELPAQSVPRFVPPAQKTEGAAGALNATWTLEGTRLTFERDLSLPARVVPAKDYPALRDLFGRATAPSALTVLF